MEEELEEQEEDILIKMFSSAPSFKQYQDYELFLITRLLITRFKDVFSRKSLPRTKDGAYVINLDDKNSKGTHWVSLILLELNIFP